MSSDEVAARERGERRAEERQRGRARLRRQRFGAVAGVLALLAGGGAALAIIPSGKGVAPVAATVAKKRTSTTQNGVHRARTTARVPHPHIVWKPIPFGATRRAETEAYAVRHYGLHTWRLLHPHVIVEHYTATPTFSSAYNTFASDAPDPELGEEPGDCAHFIIDRDGTIYQLVRLNTMCRHTVGLNWTAIGIEHVGTGDQEILDNPRQLNASLTLTVWLMSTYHIHLANVIGHNESLTSPYHHERVAAWRCQTHADWNHADMQTYRAKLRKLARRYGVPLGPPTHLAHPCG